ncbi:MAG TPA: hypothetical protein VKT78_19760 [Fimbriimonadaceae bacterium]|nr:hypothetical protein [Fimbriimonadaceae bacterium]
MDPKRAVTWGFALALAVLASTNLLHAAGQKGAAGQTGVGQQSPSLSAPVVRPLVEKWQYMVQIVGPDFYGAGKVSMNSLGQQGWELVSVMPSASRFSWGQQPGVAQTQQSAGYTPQTAGNGTNIQAVAIFKKPA